jgi:hypothetical protein
MLSAAAGQRTEKKFSCRGFINHSGTGKTLTRLMLVQVTTCNRRLLEPFMVNTLARNVLGYYSKGSPCR